MKHLIFLAITVVMFTACSKDDDAKAVVYPIEKPLNGYLKASGFEEDGFEVLDATPTEFGIQFAPVGNGMMTSITAKIPKTDSDLRVTVWDFDNVEPLRTEYFNITEAGTAVTKTIKPLQLVSGKSYMITMNSGHLYTRNKLDGASATYPFLTGNILVKGYGYAISYEQTMPSEFRDNYYCGDLDFTFQRIN